MFLRARRSSLVFVLLLGLWIIMLRTYLAWAQASYSQAEVSSCVAGNVIKLNLVIDAQNQIYFPVTDTSFTDLCKSFNATVNWDVQSGNLVIKREKEYGIKLNEKVLNWPGGQKELATGFEMRNDLPCLPLEAVEEILQLKGIWDAQKGIFYLDPLITSIKLEEDGKISTLKIIATSSVKYNSFILKEPDRFVLDIPNTCLAMTEREIFHPTAGAIRFSQFQWKPNICRVVIPMGENVEVEAAPRVLLNEINIKIALPSIYTPGQNFTLQKLLKYEVEKLNDRLRLRLTASGPVQYEWHRLRPPDNRLFIDFSLTELLEPKKEITLDDPYISEIRIAQFQKEPTPIARVVLALTQPAKCQIASAPDTPNQLLIDILHETIDPQTSILRGVGATSYPQKGGIICIDPGHGGSDPGAINYNLNLMEKDLNIDIAQRLSVILTKKGWNVLLTRNSDVDVSYPHSSGPVELGARVKIAEDMGAELFLSIHCNALANQGYSGTSTHFYKKKDRALAEMLQAELINMLQRKNRGVIRNKFYVLAHTTMPAALVEVAYLSNPTEARLLRDPNFRQKVAEALARGLEAYKN
jgi:N-acetylmuramoyl-L-alanine amidase